jgi:protoporphyrinogen oxidase
MKTQTLIAGGGLAGLSCARELYRASRDYRLVEKENEVGGLCRSVQVKGFSFDYTGHFLHFQKNEIKEWVLKLAGEKLKKRKRHAAIYSQGAYSEYPYQENNAGLPSATARENVLGYLEALLERRFSHVHPDDAGDFKTWCRMAFGPGISRNFMFPYNEKLWKTPLERLSTRWMGRFVSTPRVADVLRGAMARRPSPSGYNPTFYYPDQGGISALPRAIAAGLPNLFTGVSLQGLDLSSRLAVLSNGRKIGFENLVSSLPLPRLAAITKGLPSALRRLSRRLKAVGVYNINLGLRVSRPTPFSWIYFPEKQFLFHRAGSLSACVPTATPRKRASLYVEFSYREKKPAARALWKHTLQKIEELGWIRNPGQVLARADLDIPTAYVIYDEAREEAVARLFKFYGKNGVQSAGRYGRWEYGTMESAIEQGIQAARKIIRHSPGR